MNKAPVIAPKLVKAVEAEEQAAILELLEIAES